MIKTAFVAAAFAALAFSPASAASISCSSANLTKAEATVEAMAYSPERWAAYSEISAAQTDLLAGKMVSCAHHIGKVMGMSAMKPAGM